VRDLEKDQQGKKGERNPVATALNLWVVSNPVAVLLVKTIRLQKKKRGPKKGEEKK